MDLSQVDDGSSASGIYVSGNDVYISGNGNEDSSFYWKNGNINTLTPAQNAIAAITGDGPNIYFLGIAVESNVGVWGYWINGTFVNIPSNVALDNLPGIYLPKDSVDKLTYLISITSAFSHPVGVTSLASVLG